MQFYLQTQPNRERFLYYYGALQRARVPPSAHTYKLLIDAYATLPPIDIPAMELVFAHLIADKSVRVQGTHWASLISAYGIHAGDAKRAKEVFDKIPEKGGDYEAVVWEAWLNVLSQQGTIEQLEEAHTRMLESGVQPTAYVYNVLINGYARAGNIGRAREVFESMGDSITGVAAPNNHPVLLTSSGPRQAVNTGCDDWCGLPRTVNVRINDSSGDHMWRPAEGSRGFAKDGGEGLPNGGLHAGQGSIGRRASKVLD